MRGPALIGVALSAAMLCACSPLPQLRGDFAKVDSLAASSGKFDGTTVRWGGVVTGTRMTEQKTPALPSQCQKGVPLRSPLTSDLPRGSEYLPIFR